MIARETVKSHRPRFALRTIRNGRVKLFGREYAPSERHMKYDGRLDGLRFAFGLYYVGMERELHASLWGTERAFKAADEDTDWPGPHCVDGSFPWDWWYPVGNPSERSGDTSNSPAGPAESGD